MPGQAEGGVGPPDQTATLAGLARALGVIGWAGLMMVHGGCDHNPGVGPRWKPAWLRADPRALMKIRGGELRQGPRGAVRATGRCTRVA